ncbi:mucin-6-like [Homarus americanus]|uniref:mucin-6-like n=1 Tax=Homarus americanus TaxID=6706 RepID=UPI001C4790E2|nr:mucin-6-like [Homarus americanus]
MLATVCSCYDPFDCQDLHLQLSYCKRMWSIPRVAEIPNLLLVLSCLLVHTHGFTAGQILEKRSGRQEIAGQRSDLRILNPDEDCDDEEPEVHGTCSCCYGNEFYTHGSVVHTDAKKCIQLVCHDGEIVSKYTGYYYCSSCCEYNGQLYNHNEHLPLPCGYMRCSYGSWYVYDSIDHCCSHCILYDDIHIVTFDNRYYDFHGHLNYSLAQSDTSYSPEVGVFADFKPCSYSGLVSCLDKVTFRENPNTIVTIDYSDLGTIQVNGECYSLARLTNYWYAYPLEVNGVTYPIIVVKMSFDCVKFVGHTSKITLIVCPHRVDVLAHPSLSDGLDGLCGHYNNYQNDDFTSRSLTVYPLYKYPLDFPLSWLTNDQCGEDYQSDCPEPHLGCSGAYTFSPCMANTNEMYNYYCQCLNYLYFLFYLEHDLHHLQSCVSDLCMLYQNGQSSYVNTWLMTLKDNADTSCFFYYNHADFSNGWPA